MSRALQKFVHLFSIVVIDVMSGHPDLLVLNRPSVGVLRGEKLYVDVEPVKAGLFCLFDRIRSSKQKQQLFACLSSGVSDPQAASSNTIAARLLLMDVHQMYLNDYKFVGIV